MDDGLRLSAPSKDDRGKEWHSLANAPVGWTENRGAGFEAWKEENRDLALSVKEFQQSKGGGLPDGHSAEPREPRGRKSLKKEIKKKRTTCLGSAKTIGTCDWRLGPCAPKDVEVKRNRIVRGERSSSSLGERLFFFSRCRCRLVPMTGSSIVDSFETGMKKSVQPGNHLFFSFFTPRGDYVETGIPELSMRDPATLGLNGPTFFFFLFPPHLPSLCSPTLHGSFGSFLCV